MPNTRRTAAVDYLTYLSESKLVVQPATVNEACHRSVVSDEKRLASAYARRSWTCDASVHLVSLK